MLWRTTLLMIWGFVGFAGQFHFFHAEQTTYDEATIIGRMTRRLGRNLAFIHVSNLPTAFLHYKLSVILHSRANAQSSIFS